MKILKKPDFIIFDTENPDKMKFNRTPLGLPQPLNAITMKTDYDFLSEHFRPKGDVVHPIFKNFGSSYYYCVSV